MLTRNCSLSYRQHFSMTAVRKSHFDSASVHDIIGNHGGIHVSKNPFTKILDEERVRKSCSNCSKGAPTLHNEP